LKISIVILKLGAVVAQIERISMKSKKLIPVTIIVGLVLFFTPVYSAELDTFLREKIDHFNIQPIKILPQNSNRSLINLGKLLFAEKKLSGNRRISCQTCHDPKSGTSDTFPMSQSEDSKGILRRNAPSLFNVGLPGKDFMFWDGRVHLNSKTKIFSTPEESLNGENPQASYITSVLSSALATQALFPLVTTNEMMGAKGENEIANAENRLEAWDRIINRLKNEYPTGIDTTSYIELFSRAYPDTAADKINIGHVGEAIAAFQSEEFQSTGSPFDRYLRGDNSAMTQAQKKGFAVFMGRGHCVNCHVGGELGKGNLFASVATPQWGAAPLSLDKGRAEIINDSKRDFFYKVPSLLNLSLTAPYMHNGAYQTIREVVEHYNHISENLNNFKVSDDRQSKIPVPVQVANHPLTLDDIWLSSQSGLIPKLRNRLRLTRNERNNLEIFLKEALTDAKWNK
jgi:cytochrome c peroxidase